MDVGFCSASCLSPHLAFKLTFQLRVRERVFFYQYSRLLLTTRDKGIISWTWMYRSRILFFWSAVNCIMFQLGVPKYRDLLYITLPLFSLFSDLAHEEYSSCILLINFWRIGCVRRVLATITYKKKSWWQGNERNDSRFWFWQVDDPDTLQIYVYNKRATLN